MTNFFLQLRERPFVHKLLGLFFYGIASFSFIYLIGNVLLDNFLLFRAFELLWFIHIVIICNQIQRSQRELILLAIAGLLPGLINNIVGLFAFA
jgi:hypothetical protein